MVYQEKIFSFWDIKYLNETIWLRFHYT